MHAVIRMLATAVALAMSAGAALAVMGKTTTDVALRTAPAAQAELILNLPEGTLVNVGSCSRGWCGITWNKYGGYVRASALQFQSTPAGGPPAIPVYPPYPYKAGHYPTADAYYDLPPYAATNPSFYHWRYFMIGQERNRYRYMPHVFHGPSGYPEDTVSSSAMTPEPASEPMGSPNSPPKTEPSPLVQLKLWNRKRETQDRLAPKRLTDHPLYQSRAPQRQTDHPMHQDRAPKRHRDRASDVVTASWGAVQPPKNTMAQ